MWLSIQDPNEELQAERTTCMYCWNMFPTYRGLRLHQRKAHPTEYFAAALSNIHTADSKRYNKWSEMEMIQMAQLEAHLLTQNIKDLKINIELAKRLPGEWTAEAIKGKRRAEKYKRMVKDLQERSSLKSPNLSENSICKKPQSPSEKSRISPAPCNTSGKDSTRLQRLSLAGVYPLVDPPAVPVTKARHLI